jgi:hypothetical protein
MLYQNKKQQKILIIYVIIFYTTLPLHSDRKISIFNKSLPTNYYVDSKIRAWISEGDGDAVD